MFILWSLAWEKISFLGIFWLMGVLFDNRSLKIFDFYAVLLLDFLSFSSFYEY